MKLAVLSDIHGNLVALEAALADLDALGGADTIWVLGDLAAFGTRPAESIRRVLALREQYGEKNVHMIGGNTDRYLVTGARPGGKSIKEDDEDAADKLRAMFESIRTRDEALNWTAAQLSLDDYIALRKLGGELSLEVADYGWVIGYHGTPGDDEGFLLPDTPDEAARDALLDREGRLAIGGHIHVQMDRDLGGWRALNVGSIGMSFDQPGRAQWGLLTFESGEAGALTVDLRSVPYDVDAVFADLAAVEYPLPAEWLRARMKLG